MTSSAARPVIAGHGITEVCEGELRRGALPQRPAGLVARARHCGAGHLDRGLARVVGFDHAETSETVPAFRLA